MQKRSEIEFSSCRRNLILFDSCGDLLLNWEKVAFRLKFQLLFRLSLVFVETTVSSKVINFGRVP